MEGFETLSLKDLLSSIWNHKIGMCLIVLIFILIGYVYSYYYVEPLYGSSATLVLVSEQTNGESSNSITATDITLNSKLVSTYSEIIKSKTVLRQVKSNLDIDINENYLKNSIKVKAKKDTEILEVTVTNEDPQMAANIANELAKVFSKKAQDLYKINNIDILDEAEKESYPSNINHTKDLITFAIIGIFGAIAYVLLKIILDSTVNTRDDIEKKYKVPLLANIPYYNGGAHKKDGEERNISRDLIVDNDPKAPISEVYRTLRTNIQFMNNNEKVKSILVTSTIPGEGKTCIASNLAVTFAQDGKIVILIDGDLRKGRLNSVFNIPPSEGLSNYLSSGKSVGEELSGKRFKDESTNEELKDIASYLKTTEIEKLYVLPAGDIPSNPSELLGTSRMRKMLEQLREISDIIIIDGTPCKLVTDSLILTRLVDATIVTTNNKKTKKEDLTRIISNIQKVGGKIAGIIVNKINEPSKRYGDTYYYYGKNKDEKNTLLSKLKNFFYK